MAVTRIVANIEAIDLEKAAAFYGDILDMEILMDMEWIKTFGGTASPSPQVSFASQGGSDTPVPDLSIEVDNFDEVLAKVNERNLPLEYGPVTEPWGVKRFYVRDPFDRLINILTHS